MQEQTPIDNSEDLLTGDEFKILPEVQQQVLQRTLMLRAGLILFFFVLGFGLSGNDGFRVFRGMTLNMILLTFVPMLVVMIVFSLIGYLRQRNVLAHYRFYIGQDRVKRVQFKTPDLEIPISQIRSITENRRGDIRIQGMDDKDIIYIPYQIERKKELMDRLNGICRMEFSSTSTFVSPADRLRAIASLVAFFTALYSDKPKTILAAGAVYILLSGMILYRLAFDKNAQGTLLYRSLLYLISISYIVWRMAKAWKGI